VCWQKLDAGPFSILAPAGWEFHQLQGIDSFVGEFAGDGVVLTFDFGRYSSGYFKSMSAVTRQTWSALKLRGTAPQAHTSQELLAEIPFVFGEKN
jgi:hypothetical protein